MISCQNCGSIDGLQKRGIRNNRQRLWCSECEEWMSIPLEDCPEEFSGIPVLVLDIETGIRNAKLFSGGKQWVKADSFDDPQWMICWSAKWAGDTEVVSDCLTPKEAEKRDHSRIVKSIWELMSKAAVVVTHNGISFDQPMLNTFFMEQRLGLPSKYKSIDTCAISRKIVRLDSYRLDYMCRYFGLNTGKDEMERQDWIDCYNAKPSALKKMEKYNRNDVLILEDLLELIKPYAPILQNYGVFGDVEKSQCPYCGGLNFKSNGYYYTPNGKFNSYRCECQGLFRSRTNLLSKDKRKVQMAF